MKQSTEVLRRIEDALKQSLDHVDATEKAWSDNDAAVSRSDSYLQALAAQADKRGSLAERGATLARQTEITDHELRACEDELRDLCVRTESLRRKLAEWAGRAIG